MRNNYVFHIDKLNGEYKNKFEQVDAYCNILLEDIDSNTSDEVMSNILDTFISAQNDNMPIERIIGNDITKFCEEACKLPTKYKFKHMFEMFKNWSWILLVFGILECILEIRDKNFFDIKTNIGNFIISITVCLLLFEIYTIINKINVKRDIKNNKISKKTKIVSIILITVCIITGTLTGTLVEILIPNWIILLLSLIVIISYKICYRKEIKEIKLEKKLKNEEVSFSDLVTEEGIKQIKEKYNKINEKNKKKGKEEITEEQYLDKQIKRSNKALKIAKIYLFAPIIASILFTIPVSFESTVFDSILYFVSIFAIESLIFIPLSRTIGKTNSKLLEKYKYFKENNIKLEDWK